MLEHVNLTVADPHRTAALLIDLFGWHIRWEGPSLLGGYTVHVGTDTSYLALYRSDKPTADATPSNDRSVRNLNHVAVVVDALDEVEQRVRAAGIEPHTFGDYEPGRRFYFDDHDGIEVEVVSYNGTIAA